MKIRKGNYQSRKAQSFLEYSFLIAVVTGVLIVMIIYTSRGLQGFLKRNVEGLGSQEITTGQYSWGSGGYDKQSSVSTSRNWGFDYEHGIFIGFAIMTGGSESFFHAEAEFLPELSNLFPTAVEYETMLDGEETNMVDNVFNSPFDPGSDIVQKNVEANVTKWSYGYTDDASGHETSYAPVESLNADSQGMFDAYAPKEDPQEHTPEEVTQNQQHVEEQLQKLGSSEDEE